MSSLPAPDVCRVATIGVAFHVLRDGNGLHLIDAGFLGGLTALRRALRRQGWERESIRTLLVTHGHLDHILNVAAIAHATGARIIAPIADEPYYRGKAEHRGWSRATGVLESFGHRALRFVTFRPTQLLNPGDTLDLWGGLRAIHLPGHTAGHTGYFSERTGLLFTADLFASCKVLPHFPPAIFNDDRELEAASAAIALALPLNGVLPAHGDSAPPAIHLVRLRRIAANSGRWAESREV